ncbi:hypothetical protein [uncultured Microbacterium sp.]|uniref:hypothetical protein n=1 Tax=uncultured Microbacterium sp. TaxID=191216 RepID=UPI0028DB5118|nr:hypothetical protein [uncultured Microbacterium sp.]
MITDAPRDEVGVGVAVVIAVAQDVGEGAPPLTKLPNEAQAIGGSVDLYRVPKAAVTIPRVQVDVAVWTARGEVRPSVRVEVRATGQQGVRRPFRPDVGGGEIARKVTLVEVEASVVAALEEVACAVAIEVTRDEGYSRGPSGASLVGLRDCAA